MASAIYPKAKEQMLQGGINLSSGNIKVVGVNVSGGGTTYTYSASHEFLSDISSGARIATSGNLASKTFTDGVFDAADAVWASASGDSIEAVVVYVDTGSAASSRLIAYIDSGTGLPVTPNGADINLVWDNGANKIFKL
jgi:hypothetical protein